MIEAPSAHQSKGLIKRRNVPTRRPSGSRVQSAAQSAGGLLMIFSTSLVSMTPPSPARLVQDYEKSARGLAEQQHMSTGDETRTVGSLQISLRSTFIHVHGETDERGHR